MDETAKEQYLEFVKQNREKARYSEECGLMTNAFYEELRNEAGGFVADKFYDMMIDIAIAFEECGFVAGYSWAKNNK